MDALASKPRVTPFSLRDAPSLIERVWPAQKISVEAQKERKANVGQTLTVLGAYWKGRKPLVLVRACVLGALLPATGNPERDLHIFERLMGIDDDAFTVRERSLKPTEIARRALAAGIVKESELSEYFRLRGETDATRIDWASAVESGKLSWRLGRDDPRRAQLRKTALSQLTYFEKVEASKRPEEISEDDLLGAIWDEVNAHLGTSADCLSTLVEQLGIMRFGHRPRIADTFAGGCSIPFEAARAGCDAFAADLNPIACMLSWGAFNLLGGTDEQIEVLSSTQKMLVDEIDRKLASLQIEHDAKGNRAKAYLYCLETTCPQSGWVVPLIPNLIISTDRRVVGRLKRDHDRKRIDIEIAHVSEKQWAAAAKAAAMGTVRNGNLTYEINGEQFSTSLKTIRGDHKTASGESANRLRLWSRDEIEPRADDIFRDRLYCVQWIERETVNSARQVTFFAVPTDNDLDREAKVSKLVRDRLAEWQQTGVLPDLAIEPGENTSQPTWERGWTYWHHLFSPRHLLTLGLTKELIDKIDNQYARAAMTIAFARSLDRMAKLCQWSATPAQDIPLRVFVNQALNTLMNWGVRANGSYIGALKLSLSKNCSFRTNNEISCAAASSVVAGSDIFITDPPYADAVNYHEITEFFISWLRKNPPEPFKNWTWDSRRSLAIKGDGQEFRRSMVTAYKAMADHTPDNGLQVVMFTHQNASVWADMAQIFWGSGLRVMAAWYISTETTSELKKGGYIQGTVILVLRKRDVEEHGYKDEIVQEVKVEVADQIDTMAGLNQTLKGHGRIENLFEDADLQMAGYAAALRVLTRYTAIDGVDMAKEATRPQGRGERSLVNEVIEFAVQVANEHMVPEGMNPNTWENLSGSERFYFKMMDIETTGAKKLDNYQNFAKAFRVPAYDDLMGNLEPNKAALKTAKQLKKAGFEGSEFGASKSRALLYAIFEIEKDIDGDDVLSHLRDLVPDYFTTRDDLMALADYVATKRETIDKDESRAARILHGLIRNERFG
jgi:putative DNA methylase